MNPYTMKKWSVLTSVVAGLGLASHESRAQDTHGQLVYSEVDPKKQERRSQKNETEKEKTPMKGELLIWLLF